MKTFEKYIEALSLKFGKKIIAIYENGNHFTAILEDGTKVKQTKDPKAGYFTYDFAENMDIKITDYCDAGCPYCHEGSTTKGKHADLKSMYKIWASLQPGTEMAIGGGNALAHPDLEWFLTNVCKEKHILANITINQKHVVKYKDLIKKLIDSKLINGIGISLTDRNTFPSEVVDSFGDNVVIHTIAGILTPEDFAILKGRKVLVLGYKNLRRGESFYSKEVDKNIKLLKDHLVELNEQSLVLSFDCLGLEQLDVKKTLGIDEYNWNLLFQGSDTDVQDAEGNITCCTFYLDAVEKKCARMSTAPLDKRYDIDSEEDTYKSLFQKSIKF